MYVYCEVGYLIGAVDPTPWGVVKARCAYLGTEAVFVTVHEAVEWLRSPRSTKS